MGMAASQGRLLFMTARLSNNEFEQQCVAYSKQRLADKSEKANDIYLDALNATKYQILTGYNGSEATYASVTYNQLTGYYGDSTIALITGDLTSTQNTGVAANKQYVIKDNKGQVLVNKKIAEAFETSKGDFNKFLEIVGLEDGYNHGLTQVSNTSPSQQDVHEAWDKYLVSVNKGANDTPTEHILGFSWNNDERPPEAVEFATYKTGYIKSKVQQADDEKLYVYIGGYDSNGAQYYVNNYPVIAVPDGNVDEEGNPTYVPAFRTANMSEEDGYILIDNTNEDLTYHSETGEYYYKGQAAYYINPTNSEYSQEYRTNVSPQDIEQTQETIFYDGTTKEQRELYDYAMAVSKLFVTKESERPTYDAGRVAYYQNIFNQMTTGGFTTYKKMLDTGYMKATENNEAVAYQNDQWLITQLKKGKLNISYYSALEKDFVATTLDEDESICEKEDKSKIAIAEQEYNTAMSRIEAEDKQFDLTLNKLESEHHAIQTEYDAVTKVLSKNVEKSFGTFSA